MLSSIEPSSRKEFCNVLNPDRINTALLILPTYHLFLCLLVFVPGCVCPCLAQLVLLIAFIIQNKRYLIEVKRLGESLFNAVEPTDSNWQPLDPQTFPKVFTSPSLSAGIWTCLCSSLSVFVCIAYSFYQTKINGNKSKATWWVFVQRRIEPTDSDRSIHKHSLKCSDLSNNWCWACSLVFRDTIAFRRLTCRRLHNELEKSISWTSRESRVDDRNPDTGPLLPITSVQVDI